MNTTAEPQVISGRAMDLHRESIVIDGCAPILNDLSNAKYWIEGGFTAGFATMSLCGDDMRTTVLRLAKYTAEVEKRPDLMIVTSVADIRKAKEQGKLGVVLAFQNTSPLEHEISMAASFYKQGVRSMILAYNRAEAPGDGCIEPRNGGLTLFGRALIREMNRLGILVDVSHCGERTALEAIEHSDEPVAFTHSGAKALFDHPRNLTDEQIRAVAARYGLIGINAHACFLRDTTSPTVDDVLNHYDYIVNLVGVDHVGMGYDFSHVPGFSMPMARYEMLVTGGVWTPETLMPPPWNPPIPSAAGARIITEGLLNRGYKEVDVQKILGGNFMRVLEKVWRG